MSAETTTQEREEDPRGPLYGWVTAQVNRLAAGYVKDLAPSVARVARLRHSMTDGPSGAAERWAVLADFPSGLVGRGEASSADEIAAANALALFALHQQSQRGASVHKPGATLGSAVRQLAGDSGDDPQRSPVARRFHALVAAQDLNGTLHHLRGLITQLRGEGIRLDYGQLAVDLRDLQDAKNPERVRAVRLRWSRTFSLNALNKKPESQTSGDDA